MKTHFEIDVLENHSSYLMFEKFYVQIKWLIFFNLKRRYNPGQTFSILILFVQESKCFTVKKTVAVIHQQWSIFLCHRQPHRRLLAVRQKLAAQPPKISRLRYRFRTIRTGRQRWPFLRSHRLYGPRPSQPGSGHTSLRRHTNRTPLDRLCHQHGHPSLGRADFQLL